MMLATSEGEEILPGNALLGLGAANTTGLTTITIFLALDVDILHMNIN